MGYVTITHQDWRHTDHCEQCGATFTSMTVIRWTEPTPSQPEPVPQQTHYYCMAHEEAALRMWVQLQDADQRRARQLDLLTPREGQQVPGRFI